MSELDDATVEARCPECGTAVRYYIEGRWVSLADILALPSEPGSIERRLYHDRICTRQEARCG